MPLSPVRSLQRGSRPLGPVYNDTNRSARKLKRQGFDGAAERVALQGAAEQLAGGGSNITSAESNRDERDAAEVVQRGLMRGRRDASLSPDSGLTVEATGDTLAKRQGLYERMRSGVTPEMRKEAAGLGVTDSGFAQASSRAAQNPVAPTQSIARGVSEPPRTPKPLSLAPPTSAAGQDADNIFGTPYAQAPAPVGKAVVPPGRTGSTLQGPPAPAPVVAPAGPTPVGKIDGVPAAQAIASAQTRATKSAMEQRIATMGLSGAVADYHKRWNSPKEPGNLAELKARDFVGPPAPAPEGPLTRAMNAALARNAERASDAVGAAKVTAGLNAAPTPRLRGAADLVVGGQRGREGDVVNAPRAFDWRTTSDSKYLTKAANWASNVRLNAQDDMRAVPGVSSMLDITGDQTVRKAIANSEARNAPAPEVNNYGGRLNVKAYGKEGYVDPKHTAKVAEMEKAKKAREEKNRINMGKGTTKQPAMDRMFGPKADFLEGSMLGRYYDALNK